MIARRPEQCDALLQEAVSRGDVDAAVSLYEEDATYVVSSQEVITGRAAIRQVFEDFIAAKGTFSIDSVSVVASADHGTAITRVKGEITGPGPEGGLVTSPLHSVEVVRKQTDGSWLFFIDDPTGEGAF